MGLITPTFSGTLSQKAKQTQTAANLCPQSPSNNSKTETCNLIFFPPLRFPLKKKKVLGLALMVSCQEVKLEEVKSDVVEDVPANVVEGSTRPPLTGIPQIDYIWDPNLPPALNGYNLSNYPFYYKMPGRDEMNFECDNRLDGFYASVFHKCQVIHNKLPFISNKIKLFPSMMTTGLSSMSVRPTLRLHVRKLHRLRPKDFQLSVRQ